MAAGCTTVLLPSPRTPLTALILGELAIEAELPPGVLNVDRRRGGHRRAARRSTQGRPRELHRLGRGRAGDHAPVRRERDGRRARARRQVGGHRARLVRAGRRERPRHPHALPAQRGAGVRVADADPRLRGALRRVPRGHPARVRHRAGRRPVGPADDLRPGRSGRSTATASRASSSARSPGAGRSSPAAGPRRSSAAGTSTRRWSATSRRTRRSRRRRSSGRSASCCRTATSTTPCGSRTRRSSGSRRTSTEPRPEEGRALAPRLRAGTVYINGGGGLRPDAPFGGWGASSIGREWGAEGVREYFEPQHIQWRTD